jgi:hypothetical protein
MLTAQAFGALVLGLAIVASGYDLPSTRGIQTQVSSGGGQRQPVAKTGKGATPSQARGTQNSGHGQDLNLEGVWRKRDGSTCQGGSCLQSTSAL